MRKKFLNMFVAISLSISFGMVSFNQKSYAVSPQKFEESTSNNYEKSEKTLSEIIEDEYVGFIYKNVLRKEVNSIELIKMFKQLGAKTLSAREFVYEILDKDIFYLNRDSSTLIKIIYGVVFTRSVDQGGLKFWTLKLDEMVNSGKSVKDSVKEIVTEMINSNEFKDLIKRFNLKY